ncbi:MAG: hypothetical protein AAGN46_04120, partial [Acidobacteriota bacterium]
MHVAKPLAAAAILILMAACGADAPSSTEDSAPPAAAEPPAAEQTTTAPTEAPGPTDGDGLPTMAGAEQVTDTAGALNYQVDASIEDAAAFYRSEMASRGLTERAGASTVTEQMANLIFDGAADGRAVVVQVVPVGESRVNVN